MVVHRHVVERGLAVDAAHDEHRHLAARSGRSPPASPARGRSRRTPRATSPAVAMRTWPLPSYPRRRVFRIAGAPTRRQARRRNRRGPSTAANGATGMPSSRDEASSQSRRSCATSSAFGAGPHRRDGVGGRGGVDRHVLELVGDDVDRAGEAPASFATSS